jgi:hypothetical protein
VAAVPDNALPIKLFGTQVAENVSVTTLLRHKRNAVAVHTPKNLAHFDFAPNVSRHVLLNVRGCHTGDSRTKQR